MTKKETKKIADEETASPFPVMRLAQQMHRLTAATVAKNGAAELEIKVFEEIAIELANPSLYALLRDKLYPPGVTPLVSAAKLTLDDLQRMEEKNAATLKELEEKVDEAVESAGDMEVMDARVAVARFAAKSLSEKEAVEAYDKVLALPKVSSGKKIDSLMVSARIASFYSDTAATDVLMDKAHKLAEAGGGADWDRRNRLKVYRALQLLLHRDVKQAAGLLLDCIATFNANECCTYTEFIIYAVLTNMLHLPRPELKKKVIDGPEILSVSLEIPEVVRTLLANGYCLRSLQSFRFGSIECWSRLHMKLCLICTHCSLPVSSFYRSLRSNWFAPFTTATTRRTCTPWWTLKQYCSTIDTCTRTPRTGCANCTFSPTSSSSTATSLSPSLPWRKPLVFRWNSSIYMPPDSLRRTVSRPRLTSTAVSLSARDQISRTHNTEK